MPAVDLSPHTYREAARTALDRGVSIEAYLDELVLNDVDPEFDEKAFFTPQRLAEIDAAIAEVRNGGPTYSSEEVKAHLEESKKAWLEANRR